MAPGWVGTDLGGPQARLSIEESIPNLANTMDAQAGKAGLQSGLPRPEDSMRIVRTSIKPFISRKKRSGQHFGLFLGGEA
jgi:hypothetical protein